MDDGRLSIETAVWQLPQRSIVNRQSSILLAGRNFSETQREQRFARDTEVGRLWAVNNGKYLSFPTARTWGRRIRGLGVGGDGKGFLQLTHFAGFEFESRIAVVADVIETTRGLAGVNDILGPTLWAGNGNGGQPHRPPEWLRATSCVKPWRAND